VQAGLWYLLKCELVLRLCKHMKELRSFDNLAAMLATLRSGSPSKAARMLGRAPSSIYRAIDRLEEDVGAALFVRASAGWKATDAGLKVARLGERMQSEIAAAELALLHQSQRFPAPLRVSASDSFASFLGPVLAQFAEARPDVLIELIVDNNVVDLGRREADIAIRPDKRPGDVVGQRAGKLAHGLYGSRRVLELHGVPASLAELSHHRICVLTPGLPHFTASSWWKEQKFADSPSVSFVANTETALAAAIRDGAGVGVLPRFTGDRLDGVMRISSIPVGDPVDIWLVTHPSLRQNGVVRSLIRILAGAIRKDAGLFAGSSK
jgi:DNA-binding transcriptional LysR family regulator